MRQLFLPFFILLAMSSSYAQPTSGTVGNDLTWTYSDGTVTIEAGWGDRVMPDFGASVNIAPWLYYREDITTVVVGSGVKNIGACAFSACPQLVSVNLPESITSIGNQAFSHCSGLRGFYIPNEVTSIGNEAFSSCVNIENFQMSTAITSIGDRAFFYCYSLRDIVFPESLITIGEGVFESCVNLKFINIPASVTSIGEHAFACGFLTSVTVNWTTTPVVINRNVFNSETLFDVNLYVPAGTRDIYKAADVWKEFNIVDPACQRGTFGAYYALTWELCDGVLAIGGGGAMPDYSGESGNNPPWHSYRNDITSVIINSGITVIGDGTFTSCPKLTGIEVDSNNPFYSSENGILFDKDKTHLIRYPAEKTDVSYTLPTSVTSIGEGAFYSCLHLEATIIPESVTSIGDSAFGSCHNLTFIAFSPSSLLTSIGMRAFSNCTSLTSITLPESINSIGGVAFAGCSGLTDITVNWTETPPPINSGVFMDLTLSDIKLHVPAKTKAIYEAAEGWKEFNIVEACPSGMFGEGNALAWELCDGTLTISGTGRMWDYYNIWKPYREDITSVVIELGVQDIGEAAFSSLPNLASATIPNSVTTIGGGSFAHCANLLSITIPESVTAVMDSAFSYCSSLTEIMVAANNPSFSSEDGVLFDKDKTTLHQYPGGKADSNYTLPASVTSIRGSAFAGCPGLQSVLSSPASLLTSIGNHAFAGCSRLASITLPESVTSIEYAAFSDCSSLADITVHWTTAPPAISKMIFSGFTLSNVNLHVPTGTKALYKAAEVWKEFTIVERCPSGTFGAGDALTWALCTGTLTISGMGRMGSYYNSPWEPYREDISSIVIELGVPNIGGHAFSSLHNLVSVTIPASVTSIGEGAFIRCDNLSFITIPESVTVLRDSVFGYCRSLTEIMVATNNPSFISEGGVLFDKDKTTLYQYPGGKTDDTYTLPASVTSIKGYSFAGCSGLQSIVFPESVNSIGYDAFSHCNNLTDITVNWTTMPLAISSNVFRFVTLSNINLHVPAGTKALYEAAEVWKEFTIVDPSGTSCPSGTFGDSDALTWMFCDGTLTISGTGAIPNYGGVGNPPWHTYKGDITSLILLSGVERIGAQAFVDCSNLASVTIPESVTVFGDYAFLSCTSLSSIALPVSVTYIGDGAFALCPNLSEIAVDPGNTAYSSEDGVLFDKNKGTIIQYPAGKTDDSYALPTSVTAIGANAFGSCHSLASVALPASVVSIGNYAFVDCSGLIDLVVNWTTAPPAISSAIFGSLTLSTINLHVPAKTRGIYETAEVWQEFNIVDPFTCDWGIFGAGGALTWELCDETLTISGAGAMPDYNNSSNLAPWYAYRDRVNTAIVESGVTSIGNFAFHGCSRLASISIPASVTSVGEGVFSDCSSLTEIAVASNNPDYSSEAGVLYNKNKATIVRYPAGKTGDSYTLPASVLSIGNNAFSASRSLASIAIPPSVAAIGPYAFADCSGLTEIMANWTTTPPAVGSNVFSGLTLSAITLNVPARTRAIYEVAEVWKEFNVVDPSGCYWGTFGAGGTLIWELCDGTLTIYGVGAIPDYGNLFAVSGAGAASDNNDAGNRPPWYAYREEITSVIIESEITAIGARTFAGCINLTDVTVNWTETPPVINSNIFEGLTLSNITLHVPEGTESMYEDAEVWKEFNIEEQAPVGIQVISQTNTLKAYVQNGILRVNGLTPGETLNVYDVTATQVYRGAADGNEATVTLRVRGVYIVVSGGRSIKAVY
jgi:hypothetical protein